MVNTDDAQVLRLVDLHRDNRERTAKRSDGDPPPPWAVALDELLQSAGEVVDTEALALARFRSSRGAQLSPEAVDPPPSEGYGATAVGAFVPWARARLRNLPVCPPPALERSLVSHLVRRLLSASLGCLRGGGDQSFRDGEPPVVGWCENLRRAPALGPVIATIATEWATFAAELVHRIERDRAELAVAYGRGNPPVLADDFTCEPVGDTHDHGRCVLLVTPLGEGSPFLYKPKDTRLTDALSQLLEAIGSDLVVPARVGHAAYAWESFVVASPPSSDEGWARLARDVGMWTCLFCVLGSSDIHSENVVIAGDRLIPVDTETIVPFLFVDPGEAQWIPAGSSTAMLTAPLLRRANVPATNLGLLADTSNAPLLGHIDDMVDGFVVMHRQLVGRRTQFVAAIESWARLPARALVRPSWVYAFLLRDSLKPESLAGTTQREAILARLDNEDARSRLPAPIIESEIAALRDGEIPLFRILVGERDVIGQDGRVAEAVLHEPAVAGIRRRIRALPAEPAPADTDSLAALAYCAAPEHRADRHPVDSEAAAAPIQWTSWARQSMRELVTFLRRGGPSGTRLRAGLGYVPNNDVFVLTVRRQPDLLSGSAGLALTLASAATAVDEDLATHVLDESRIQAAELVDGGRTLVTEVRHWLDGGAEAPRWHPYWGLPAVLHALWTLPPGVLAGTGSELVVAAAEDMLADFDPGEVWEPYELSGAAGLLVALESRARRRPPEDPRGHDLCDVGDRIAAHLVAGWEHHPRLSLQTSQFAAALPSVHGIAALALWRRATRTRTELPSGPNAWRAAATPEQSGDRLVLVAMGARPAGLGHDPDTPRTSFEHLVSMEEGLISYRDHGDELALARAEDSARAIVQRRELHGRWFPEGLAGDRFRLSAMWGLAAVFNNLQGLAAPRTTRSLRLLDPGPEVL